MKSPILWYGGKNNLAKHIIPCFYPHTTFVDAFGGSAAILLAKKPSPVEVYNDIHEGVVHFFRILRDKPKELYQEVVLYPYSRKEYLTCCENWAKEKDEVKRAAKWFVTQRQAFSGIQGGSWSYSKTQSRRGVACTVSKYLSAIERLPEVAERLRLVQIECLPWEDIVVRYDTPETLFYCDPPYVPESRVAKNMYQHEFSVVDHERLVQRLLTLQGNCVLSGYETSLYTPLEEAGWKKQSFSACVHSHTGTVNKRTECLWIKERLWNI